MRVEPDPWGGHQETKETNSEDIDIEEELKVKKIAEIEYRIGIRDPKNSTSAGTGNEEPGGNGGW